MSQPQPRHATSDPTRDAKAVRTVRFWAAPIVITLALMSALAALYLGGILNPTTNLRHFPIAVVNEDAGPAGAQIVDGLLAGLDKNKFDIRVVSYREAQQLLDSAGVYGLAVIPPTFSSQLRDFGASAVLPTHADRPVITVSTNPRAGTLGSSIAGQILTQAMTVVNSKVGQRLTTEVAAQTGGAQLTGASALGLTNPIDVKSTIYNPLPNGTGNGLSAFYYALLLLLAGFTGSIVVSTLVDSMLGYIPAEFGPVYRYAEQINISRFRTLLVKWGLMVALALLTSAVYLSIAHGLGMPIPLGWQLWLYGVFAISAVGITSSSLIAVLGSMGLLVSMLIFVILGLPSAGATVPLEAVPPFFRWLAEFEPMHQVFLGVRSLLYLKGHADAGMSQALLMTALGMAIGLLLGGVVTRIYDRGGYHRIPGAVGMAIAEWHQAKHQARLRPHENSSEQT
ncbi:YhgE/Pip domain-containing protein [Mycobacterium haemophilum]|uniref:Membrane protein n=1 Tax=Mycobacterium haemophilum TaxID=29311 RepID=A0A0I9VGZ0_9MYCO|nr:YhgE/Pip domain-containing protein [Mycobacterium haemophilum]KLO32160.1 membrane protein [Mycobacterium haemophilum]KLO36567.1 membrane protein [Mycobacterium haemophilum]KLO42493.1 membrane protein [Mycobacterium haemophilum]KLO55370.1 membrane protein [Mycobacterium haemophilum]